jgi:phytoene synthase
VRFSPNRQRSLSLYVLLRELFAVVLISDAGVAHAKLAWWRTELARVQDGNATHPLAQALQASGFAAAGAVEQLMLITAAVETDMTQSRFLDDLTLTQYLDAAAAAPARALAIAAGLSQSVQQTASAIGLALGRCRIVTELGGHARQQRIYVPHQTLREFQVPAGDILGGRDTPHLKRLAAALSAQAQAGLAQGVSQLHGRERREMRSLVVLAALARARLAEIADDGFRIAVHRVGMTPLRKLIVGWRSAYLNG